MVCDIAIHTEYCRSCAKSKYRRRKKQHKTNFPASPLFPSDPLHYIAIALLGQLLKTRNENQFMIVIANRYSKLTHAVPMSKTTAPHTASMMLNHKIIPNEIPNNILLQNGLQFVAEFWILILRRLPRTTHKPMGKPSATIRSSPHASVIRSVNNRPTEINSFNRSRTHITCKFTQQPILRLSTTVT